MENNGRVSDNDLIDMATKAVREFFPQHVIDTSSIEIYHSIMAPADVNEQDGDTKASIWFVHETTQEKFNPKDIAWANQRIWEMLRERGDNRYVPLSHSYRSDPHASRKAA